MGAKTWKDLKAKQKLKLSEAMFKMVCDYFREHGQMPDDTDVEKLARRFYNNGRGLGLSYESVYEVFAGNRPVLRNGLRKMVSRSRPSPR